MVNSRIKNREKPRINPYVPYFERRNERCWRWSGNRQTDRQHTDKTLLRMRAQGYIYSKTSISGPSEERTPPLERTDQLPPIELTVTLLRMRAEGTYTMIEGNKGLNPFMMVLLYSYEQACVKLHFHLIVYSAIFSRRTIFADQGNPAI